MLPQLRRSNRVRRKPRWMDTDVYEFSQLSTDTKLHLLQSFISVLTPNDMFAFLGPHRSCCRSSSANVEDNISRGGGVCGREVIGPG